MSKAAINITYTLAATYPLTGGITATSILFKGSLTYSGSNAVYLQGIDKDGVTADVPFGALNQPFVQDYSAVDLSTLKIKGTAGEKVTLVGEKIDDAMWGKG